MNENQERSQPTTSNLPTVTRSGNRIHNYVLERQAENRTRYTDDAAPPYRCRTCLNNGKVMQYDKIQALATHVRRAHGGKPWSTRPKGRPVTKEQTSGPRKCLFPGCGRTFRSDNGAHYHCLAAHGILMMDTGRGNAECPECRALGGRFKSSEHGVRAHIKSYHHRGGRTELAAPLAPVAARERSRGGFVAFRREELFEAEPVRQPPGQDYEIRIPVLVTLRISATHGAQEGGM